MNQYKITNSAGEQLCWAAQGKIWFQLRESQRRILRYR